MIDKLERNPKKDGNTALARYEVPEEQKKAYEQMFGRPWYPGAERFVDDAGLEAERDSSSDAGSDKPDPSSCKNPNCRI